jgi:hypothetical protein
MSVSSRLNALAPDLVDLGKKLSPEKREALALRIAGWACEKTDAESYLGRARLDQLLNGSNAHSGKERSQLRHDVEVLDEKYFNFQDEDNDGTDSSDSLEWFAKARAVSSLMYSLESQSLEAFCEALYEAHVATFDLSALRRMCRQLEN